jgi:hypothetical protein
LPVAAAADVTSGHLGDQRDDDRRENPERRRKIDRLTEYLRIRGR